MKTVKSLKDITTLEVGDVVVFGDLEYKVTMIYGYYLSLQNGNQSEVNNKIFKVLNISKKEFVKNLGIDIVQDGSFPEVKSLEALTAIVSALFKEYEKQNELPKTWEEFCEQNRAEAEYYISNGSCITCVAGSRNPNTDKNLCTSKQEAEAFLALMQLRQLRKAYVKDWEPDWKDTKQYKAYIMYSGTDFIIAYFNDVCSSPLSFPTHELATQFLTNFKDLLKIAKPLL